MVETLTIYKICLAIVVLVAVVFITIAAIYIKLYNDERDSNQQTQDTTGAFLFDASLPIYTGLRIEGITRYLKVEEDGKVVVTDQENADKWLTDIYTITASTGDSGDDPLVTTVYNIRREQDEVTEFQWYRQKQTGVLYYLSTRVGESAARNVLTSDFHQDPLFILNGNQELDKYFGATYTIVNVIPTSHIVELESNGLVASFRFRLDITENNSIICKTSNVITNTVEMVFEATTDDISPGQPLPKDGEKSQRWVLFRNDTSQYVSKSPTTDKVVYVADLEDADTFVMSQYIADKNVEFYTSNNYHFNLRYLLHEPSDEQLNKEAGTTLYVDGDGDLAIGTNSDSVTYATISPTESKAWGTDSLLKTITRYMIRQYSLPTYEFTQYTEEDIIPNFSFVQVEDVDFTETPQLPVPPLPAQCIDIQFPPFTNPNHYFRVRTPEFQYITFSDFQTQGVGLFTSDPNAAALMFALPEGDFAYLFYEVSSGNNRQVVFTKTDGIPANSYPADTTLENDQHIHSVTQLTPAGVQLRPWYKYLFNLSINSIAATNYDDPLYFQQFVLEFVEMRPGPPLFLETLHHVRLRFNNQHLGRNPTNNKLTTFPLNSEQADVFLVVATGFGGYTLTTLEGSLLAAEEGIAVLTPNQVPDDQKQWVFNNTSAIPSYNSNNGVIIYLQSSGTGSLTYTATGEGEDVETAFHIVANGTDQIYLDYVC
jgi:hypothetical protein